MGLLSLTVGVVFHPLDTFYLAGRYREKLMYRLIFLMLFSAALVRVVSLYTVHYPLSTLQPREANLIFELMKVVGPVLLFSVSAFAITSIMDGESKFKEIFFSACLALIPYIFFTLPLCLLSRIMGTSELWLYRTLSAVIMIWVLLLFFLLVKILNDYSFGKTVFAVFLIACAMLILFALIMLLYLLTNQLFEFFKGIAIELAK